MNEFFLDHILISSFILIITVFFGNVLQLIGKIFRKKETRYEFVDEINRNQKNWKRIGGNKIHSP
ncbi:hypothetical protein [Fervidibacillus albus]|uniref:Uncharacterized protein n=1 Tax=Fervidibacillus albus TaxID=2980026 RepID=A0A9E8RUT2_9BACI|nr:hypothetical protein [Fervidibacillus albus]WAA08656.1 hypothetical protein OE104_08345 [Fervidibacillus albus]